MKRGTEEDTKNAKMDGEVDNFYKGVIQIRHKNTDNR